MQAALPNLLGPNKPDIPDLTGKVAVITGGALGIGFEIAKALSLHGCRTILLNRKEEQGDDAKKEISEAGGKAEVEWRHVDLGNLKEVKEVFGKIAEEEKRLDYLVLSSGINTNQYGETHDGIDRHFEVNWLGHFYAINILFPLIRKTSKEQKDAPRIVFESSEMHRTARSDVKFASKEEINDPEHGQMALYGRTKLAMILGTKYIYENIIKKNGDNVICTAVHPGDVMSEMQQQWKDAYPGVTGKVLTAANLAVGRSVEQGSYSGLYALVSTEVIEKNYNGYYLSDPATPGKETSQAADPELRDNLWKLSTEMVEDVLGKGAIQSWDA